MKGAEKHVIWRIALFTFYFFLTNLYAEIVMLLLRPCLRDDAANFSTKLIELCQIAQRIEGPEAPVRSIPHSEVGLV